MKKKPDLLWTLAVILGLGVVTTGYTQSFWESSSAEKLSSSYEVQSISVPHTNTGR